MRAIFARTAPLVLVLAALSFGCSGAAAENHVVEIRGLDFFPSTVAASPGDTVTFFNKDVMPHTATSDDGAWDSGAIEAGDEWTLDVEAGFGGGYTCTFHPSMSGELAVD